MSANITASDFFIRYFSFFDLDSKTAPCYEESFRKTIVKSMVYKDNNRYATVALGRFTDADKAHQRLCRPWIQAVADNASFSSRNGYFESRGLMAQILRGTMSL